MLVETIQVTPAMSVPVDLDLLLLCAVLGVSGDDVESHVKFIGDQQIPFQLLADEGNKVFPQTLFGLSLSPSPCHALSSSPLCMK